MATQTIYYISLVGHIIGLTMMAGTTLVQFVTFNQFWKQYETDKPKGLAINETLSKFPVFFNAGFLLLLISGITMMYITHGAFGEQIWFQVKLGLIIVILINGVAFGRRQSIKLMKLLSGEVTGKYVGEQLLKIRRNFSLFHVLQLALFLTIYILSVFKFN
jgi:hypothetical protein